jgi:hypothetical protein
VGRRLTVLLAVNVQCAARQVNLFPPERHKFADAQSRPVSDQYQRPITQAVTSLLAGGDD